MALLLAHYEGVIDSIEDDMVYARLWDLQEEGGSYPTHEGEFPVRHFEHIKEQLGGELLLGVIFVMKVFDDKDNPFEISTIPRDPNAPNVGKDVADLIRSFEAWGEEEEKKS